MVKVLIIGKNSYIGNNLEQKILEHFNTNNVDVKSEPIIACSISGRNGEWKKTDFKQYDVVVLLSAIVHQTKRNLDEGIYMEVNYKMAVDIGNKCRTENVKKFIFMSSASVYGDVSIVTKDSIPHPTTIYGKSKRLAELELETLANDKFDVIIVRPPMVYGEGCKGNYSKLVWLAKKLPVVPKVNNRRSVIHIDILTEFLVRSILEGNSGYYHPRDKENRNTSEWIKEIREKHGKKTIMIPALERLIKLLLIYNGKMNKVFGNFEYDDLLM